MGDHYGSALQGIAGYREEPIAHRIKRLKARRAQKRNKMLARRRAKW